MRDDSWTQNGLNTYELNTSQSTTGANYYNTDSSTNDHVGYWGIRIWKRSSAGVETEITAGSAVAIVSRDNSSGLISATYTPPQTVLSPTDTIVIRVYAGFVSPPTTLGRTFTTQQLGAVLLEAVQWTVWYFVDDWFNDPGNIRYFYWGTSTYNSRILNFTYATKKKRAGFPVLGPMLWRKRFLQL